MILMAVCGVFLLAGLAGGAVWARHPFCSPEVHDSLPTGEAARRFVWYFAVTLTAGIAAGITVIGAGGRLAMRLLAVTGGDAAQGRVTEAEEVVGQITAGGTISFVVFNGIFGGVIAGGLYVLVRRFLPPGWLGGVVFGLGLLVVLGTTMDPLRAENPDFDIVGPGWLAVVVFTAMALAFGVTLAAMTARLSAWLPLPSTQRRVLMRYAVPAVLAAIGFSITIPLALVGLAVVGATRWVNLPVLVRSARVRLIGRVLSLGLVVVALPNAVDNVLDIATR